MTMFRNAVTLAGLAIGCLALSVAPAAAQAPTSAVVAPTPAPVEAQRAGPRLAPRWEPAPVLLPGQTEGREINAAARGTVTIPVVTLLLGIIILILLVG
ncbi:MAG: hypothetical protein ABIR59_04715 [Gemmatimonadales bacterium]